MGRLERKGKWSVQLGKNGAERAQEVCCFLVEVPGEAIWGTDQSKHYAKSTELRRTKSKQSLLCAYLLLSKVKYWLGWEWMSLKRHGVKQLLHAKVSPLLLDGKNLVISSTQDQSFNFIVIFSLAAS